MVMDAFSMEDVQILASSWGTGRFWGALWVQASCICQGHQSCSNKYNEMYNGLTQWIFIPCSPNSPRWENTLQASSPPHDHSGTQAERGLAIFNMWLLRSPWSSPPRRRRIHGGRQVGGLYAPHPEVSCIISAHILLARAHLHGYLDMWSSCMSKRKRWFWRTELADPAKPPHYSPALPEIPFCGSLIENPLPFNLFQSQVI